MEQRLVCDTVKDLLPMYIDNMTSVASNESIEEHIKGCEGCRAVLEQMKQPLAAETAPDVKEFKRFLKKSKLSLLYWIMGAAAVIAIVTCFIVNLAVEGRLSWVYIVAAGIVTAYAPAYVFVVSGKRRFVKALAVLSVCTVVLVGTVQIVLYYLMNIGGLWFWRTGLPVALLWIAIVWLGVAANMLFHANAVLAMALIAFLSAPGNYLTHWLVGDLQRFGDRYGEIFFEDFGNFMAAAVLLLIGIVIQKRKVRKKQENGEQLF